MYIQVSEDEFTAIKQYGIWELEQAMRPLLLETIAKKERNYGSNKK